MTIAIAIRTGSSVVFAADSKVTTRGIIGLKADGHPRWVDQTYDNATKVVHDAQRTMMAMVAGYGNIGQISATDFIMRRALGLHPDASTQDKALAGIVDGMVQVKKDFWSTSKVPADQWPGPTLLVGAPGPDGINPRIWRIRLVGSSSQTRETLTRPGLRLEGSYNELFGLIYGSEPDVLNGIGRELYIRKDRLWKATDSPKVLRPVDKINFATMPIQDAIDFAVFLANVQVEMDRFLPGTPACGGPIDVMVLRMSPQPNIDSFLGKTLHHPRATG
jgi:hypothetical protein